MVEKTDQETSPAEVRCEGRIKLRVPHLRLVRRLLLPPLPPPLPPPLLLPLPPHNADTPGGAAAANAAPACRWAMTASTVTSTAPRLLLQRAQL